MSGLNIAERRLPQDGRIQLTVAGKPIDLRVSTLPTQFGESVVLRVLDRSVVSLDLENKVINVTVDEDVKLVAENQSVYIPLGAIHRLENPGKVDLHLIEVQTGAYLGEDDIVRYEDVYAREEAA